MSEMEEYLLHFGVKGMHWGVRRNKESSSDNYTSFYKESNKSIKENKDGSKTIPSGFSFNRVGKSSMDINESGALYMSYGKQDAARYIKALGPTVMGKLMGTAGEAVQHISAKSDLKMASDSQTATETAKLLISNPNLLKTFNESFYSSAVTGDLTKDVSMKHLEKALSNPGGKEGQKLAYSVGSILADPSYVKEARTIYDHFRKKGFDAIPDLHDTLSGTSKTATIVINPNKLKITSTTKITKDVFKTGKKYVESLEKLKISDLIK